MKRVCAIFYFILFLCGIFVSVSYSQTQEDILFGNMTYLIGDENSSEKVTLVNGEYRDPLLCVYYDGDFVYGDFNRDGLEDAAVVISDSGGGSGYSLSLAFLINDERELIHASSYDLGYKSHVTFLAEWQGEVVVDTLVPDRREGSGGFPIHVRKKYAYVGPAKWGPQHSGSGGY